jgi:hypothetical protein
MEKEPVLLTRIEIQELSLLGLRLLPDQGKGPVSYCLNLERFVATELEDRKQFPEETNA